MVKRKKPNATFKDILFLFRELQEGHLDQYVRSLRRIPHITLLEEFQV